MHRKRRFSQIDILNISNQNDKLLSRSNMSTHNRTQVRNCWLFNKFVHKKLYKYCFRMSKDVENVRRSITIAIDVVVIVVLKRCFVVKSCFDLTFSFDLSRTKTFVSLIDCTYIVFVHKIIDCCFMNRKKHCRKMLRICSRILDMRMKKRQRNNFFLRFRNYIRILFYIVTKKRFDKHYLKKEKRNFFSYSRNYKFDCVHK